MNLFNTDLNPRGKPVVNACKLTKSYPVSWILSVLNISLIDHKLEEEIWLKQRSKSYELITQWSKFAAKSSKQVI